MFAYKMPNRELNPSVDANGQNVWAEDPGHESEGTSVEVVIMHGGIFMYIINHGEVQRVNTYRILDECQL